MSWQIIQGDALETLKTLPDQLVQCCVTSPPYWGLRDFGVPGQMGLESTMEEYVTKMVDVFREVKRVLRNDGTLWLNLGDCYLTSYQKIKCLGLKPKNLVGIPWRIAFALQADGWYLRSDIIWAKPNPMPESVTDRPTKAHEYIFLLTKSERYYYDHEAIKEKAVYGYENNGVNFGHGTDKEKRNRPRVKAYSFARKVNESPVPGSPAQHRPDLEDVLYIGSRNKRSVWTVATEPFKDAHFATFPTKLIEPCILAGSRPGDLVLDPFSGAGTTGLVALRHGRRYLGIELNPEYVEMSKRRIRDDMPLFNGWLEAYERHGCV